MNWKEEYLKRCGGDVMYPEKYKSNQDALDLISTEIIEKIIDEIPSDADMGDMDYPFQTWDKFKQELRDKWL